MWGVVLGDVSGKGAEAAAVTALARYTLRALADPRHPPSRTLGDAQRRGCSSDIDVERHCTLVYALVRPREGFLEVTLCLAGHHASADRAPRRSRSSRSASWARRWACSRRRCCTTPTSSSSPATRLPVHRRSRRGASGPDLFGEERVAEILEPAARRAAARTGRRAGRRAPPLPRTPAGRRPRGAAAPRPWSVTAR